MKKFQITAAVLALLCLVSIAAALPIIDGMAGKLVCQNAAGRWSGDGTRMAQVSAFVSPEASLRAASLQQSLPGKLDTGMTTWSIAPVKESARIYAWGYSAEADVTLSRVGEFGQTLKAGVSARAVACGGDFFLFHPLVMLSGQTFPTDIIPDDSIVIDNDLAWQFFGSPDVVGQKLQLNGRDVYISGVCEAGPAGDYAEFYGDEPRVFIPYSLAQSLLGDLSVTAVEAVMPDPVSGFAIGLFRESLGTDESLTMFVENSARFTDASLREKAFSGAEQGVRTKPVAYPYWENTAVILTGKAALVYLFKLIPMILLVLLAASEIVLAYIMRRRIFAFFAERIRRAASHARQNRAARKAQKLSKERASS